MAKTFSFKYYEALTLFAENSIPVFSITEKGNRITQDEEHSQKSKDFSDQENFNGF